MTKGGVLFIHGGGEAFGTDGALVLSPMEALGLDCGAEYPEKPDADAPEFGALVSPANSPPWVPG